MAWMPAYIAVENLLSMISMVYMRILHHCFSLWSVKISNDELTVLIAANLAHGYQDRFLPQQCEDDVSVGALA
jgi:hypothetical protein